MTAPDPRPLSAAELDEMDRLARDAINAATAYYALPEDTWDREAPEADALAKADAEFIALCTPSRISSLVALARRGAALERLNQNSAPGYGLGDGEL